MDLYLPRPNDQFTDQDSWKWYGNISIELKTDLFSSEYKAYLEKYYIEAGLLRRWRRPFFRHHYARTFALAVSFLFANPDRKPVILDLGCGTGTQSLAFALLGAKVFCLDMDSMALDILNERKKFYERQSGRALDIQIWSADVFGFNYASIAPIDGVYSLFAFNMMQPSRDLISLLAPHMSDNGKIALLDGNRLCWASRVLPWRRRNVLSPKELEAELRKYGFSTADHYGGVTFPPAFWRCFPYPLLSRMDSCLASRSWVFPVSHQILAGRL
jgi:SAM-dependent methyltransferase